mmetsp:Transcript_59472/g.81260  ORF Transcript_59472/g.81260 Transcript_59472/m.81260 type:complete len:94 (-) Transcript_59472:106-387(-)
MRDWNSKLWSYFWMCKLSSKRTRPATDPADDSNRSCQVKKNDREEWCVQVDDEESTNNDHWRKTLQCAPLDRERGRGTDARYIVRRDVRKEVD